MANALTKGEGGFHALVPARGSVAAGVQAAVPGSLVSAAFHHLPAKTLGDLDTRLDADVLVCADAPEATAATSELIERVPGLRALDAGGLHSAMPVEALTAVLLQLNVRYKAKAGVRITGVE
jgi:NADPH-dependent F420 reductase